MRYGRISAGLGTIAVVALAGLTVARPVAAGARAKKAAQIEGQERVIHALNRFTFGPTPGEVAAVEKMGLRQWFDEQLNPASIDDSALDARLAAFPAMQMPQADLMAVYPTQQRLKEMIRTHTSLPANPVERAIYADGIARVTANKEKKADKGQNERPDAAKMTPGNDMNASANTMNAAANDMGAAAQEEKLYADLDAVKVINLPPNERIARMVAMPPDEFMAFRRSLNPRQVARVEDGLTPQQREIFEAMQNSERMVADEVLESRMMRDIYSRRQLQEVMTDFWLNHFNVYLRKNQYEPYLLPDYERNVIRPHALGRFEDLLVATAKSPAMMVYLDNWLSIGPDSRAALNAERAAQRGRGSKGKRAKDRGLNENYGRELMELHTLGVKCEVSADRPAKMLDKACGNGYTQQDVIEVAQTLTGWTIDRPNLGAEFQFDERRHEPGAKKVLGVKIKENGEAEGMQVLHMLATSPATAKLISTQLAVRFVSDTPPPALVERMAKSFVASGGDIKTVLRTMFDSPEFWSPEVYRAKVKTPEEFVVSAVRASGADVTDARPLVAALNRLGMPLYGMQTPNGYDWKAGPWVNTGDLVNRMNFALLLSSDRMNGVHTDWRGLLGEETMPGESAEAKEQRLESLLLDRPASEHTRATVLAQFSNSAAAEDAMRRFPGARMVKAKAALGPAADDRQAEAMAGLLLGSPDFQRR